MEIAQEAPQVLMMGSNIHDQDHGYVNVVVKKRKRTKRQRAPSSPNLVAGITTTTTTTTTTSTSSSTGGTGAGLNITSSSSDHHQFSESSSEEEDMANCLILLAQGHNHNNNNNIGSKRPIEEIIAGTAIEKCQILTEVAAAPTTTFTSSTICKQLATTGFDAYECKTCNRCFPSFQALGGHRASHKRPIKALGLIQDQEQKKMTISTSTTSGFLMMEQEETQFINENTIIHPSLTLQMGSNKNNNINSNRILSSSTSTSTSNHHHHQSNNNNNKSRIHECSICGSEFSSGQALGGHMRRHRSSTITTTTSSTAIMSSSQLETASTNKKSRNNGLSLDLNLPAPEEDHMNKFIFASKQQQPALVVFSAASLVDCHY